MARGAISARASGISVNSASKCYVRDHSDHTGGAILEEFRGGLN